ncbi:MAG: hypothetical protein J6Q35_07200 [Rikenellaceae bacterium]|nr:hypothetical protein [Rikenellaceae bacterium]
MNMKFFLTTVFALSIWGCVFAQMPRSSKQEYRQLAEKERIKDSLNNTFEHLSLDKPDGSKYGLRTCVENILVAKGDTWRVKYVFQPSLFTKLVAEGIREATPEEMKKGECIFAFKPEKTQWIKIIQYGSDGSKYEGGSLVYVVEPEKYESVMQRYKSLKGLKDKNDFLDSIAGGRWIDFKYGRKK